ncbi:MAG: hypothetical protein KDK05_28940 [Candidatus Competibacteraceae bacterium]|nr:hypothetical protein [Candidatus Competibacteraceae bacterium]
MSDATHMELPLYSIAHARTGDKGNRVNIGVFAYQPEFYPLLLEQVTEARVLSMFQHRGASRVVRYELPQLQALNLVIDDVLEGGVNGSLNLDGHGKTLAFLLLALPLQIPQALLSE